MLRLRRGLSIAKGMTVLKTWRFFIWKRAKTGGNSKCYSNCANGDRVASFSPAGGLDVNRISTDRWLVAEEREEGLFMLDCMTAIDPSEAGVPCVDMELREPGQVSGREQGLEPLSKLRFNVLKGSGHFMDVRVEFIGRSTTLPPKVNELNNCRDKGHDRKRFGHLWVWISKHWTRTWVD